MKGLSIKEWLLIIVSVTIVCLLIWNAVTLNEIFKAQRRIESGVDYAQIATYNIQKDLSNIETYLSQIDIGWDYSSIESHLYTIESDLYSIKSDLASIEQRLYRIEYTLRYER